MKQTKPFGRAFIPSAELQQAQASSDAPPHEPAPSPFPLSPARPSAANNHSGDIFELRSNSVPRPARPAEPLSWRKLLRQGAIYCAVIGGLFVVYVGMRDSMILANMLDVLPTEDTIMQCKAGTVWYDENADIISKIADRILDRGHLICTDWRVQHGFRTAPRP